MAFLDQVQDLTSLTVSDNDELSQFLRDGVIDVTAKCLAVKPQDREDFARESDEVTTQASEDLNGAQILSVVRESGTNNDWRGCRKISSALQSRVADIDSLHYASKFNPAYMIGDNNKISVFPAPGSDPNAYKVYYVNNVPVESDGSTLRYTSANIKYFPNDKVYLVVMYAAMKLLQANMGATTLSTLAITTVPPDVPSLTSTSLSFSTAAPVYTKPTVTGDGDELTDVSILASDNTIDVLADQIEFDQWWSTAAHFIEDEEDPELAQLQLQKIQAYTSAYQTEMQNQLNVFNDATVEYQAQLQISIENAKLESQDDAQKLQKFQAEVSAYQSDVQGQVQEYGAKIQEATAEYQWLQTQYVAIKADYDTAFAIMAPRQPQGAR